MSWHRRVYEDTTEATRLKLWRDEPGFTWGDIAGMAGGLLGSALSLAVLALLLSRCSA